MPSAGKRAPGQTPGLISNSSVYFTPTEPTLK